MKIFLTSLALFACAHPAFSQGTSPRFVRLGDLNTSQVTTEPTSGGATLLETGELVFSGSDSEAGEEIWIKSSYYNEARRVVDFRPGGASSSPRDFAPLDGHHFSVVVDDGITGPEVVVLDSDGDFFPNDSGMDLCPGRDHAAPRLLGRVVDAALYILDDGADPFGQPGESVWMFASNDYPLWLGTFKPGSVRQPRNGTVDELYFVGQRWDEAEFALFRVNGVQANQAELLCVMGTPAVAEPLPDQVYAVTPSMVCYRGFNGSQPILRAFRTYDPGDTITRPLWPVMNPSFTSNGDDRICYVGYDPVTGIEPWMIVDDHLGSPLTPELVVDSNPSTFYVTASQLMLQGNLLYFETGAASRELKFVDTSVTSRVPFTIFSDSQYITRRLLVSSNQLAFVTNSGGGDSLFLYDTTSRIRHSLSQNVTVRDFWSEGFSLNTILEDGGNDHFARFLGASGQFVRTFMPGSARHLQVTGIPANSTAGWGIGVTQVNEQPKLFDAYMGNPVPMRYEGPSNSASSHPADFHDINGHLFLTAVKDGQRQIFHSPDGAQDSLQPVEPPRGSWESHLSVKEMVRLADQLFATSASDGSLHVIKIQLSGLNAGNPFSMKVLDGTTPIPAERLTVAAGKVFFVQVGATTETLRFVNPDLSLGTVQVFQKPATGQAITQMTGTPDRLFFTASTNPNDSTSPVAVWSTTGSGMPEQRMLHYQYDSLQILGIWGGHLVFWGPYQGSGGWFDVFTWSGLPGEGLLYRTNGDPDRRPASSHTPGIPSGVEFDGGFAYCTREGHLTVLGSSAGTAFQWSGWSGIVHPECLAVLNGKLVWKAYAMRLWDLGLWDSQWFRSTSGDAYQFIGSKQGAPSPLQLAAGRVWSVAGSRYETVLTSWNGVDDALQDLSEPIDPYEALGDVSMGTYRGRLVLSARRDFVAGSGFEPTILLGNTAPAPQLPLKRFGARPGQPFTFTYEDLLTWGITDAEGDSFLLEISILFDGSLKLNGSPTSVSSHVQLHPGDILEWTPSTGPVGDVEAIQLHAADTWDDLYFPLIFRVETPHEEWTRQHFTPQQLADPLISGPEADADGDGVSNALEFLFGRLPHQHEGERGWSFTSTSPAAAGQRRAVFTFNRLAVLPHGTTVLIEQSEDLQSWTSVAEKLQNAAWTFPLTGVSVEEVTLPDGRIETRVAVEESASLNRFLRLRVLLF